MAENTAVYSIDVIDDKFRAFLELFNEYDRKLREHRQLWQGMMGGFRAPDLSTPGAGSLSRMDEAENKERKRVNSSLHAFNLGLRQAVGNVLKFGSIAIGGGALGINAMLKEYYDERKQATGMGVGIVEKQSAENAYNRVFEVDALLSKINEAKTNPSVSWALNKASGVPIDELYQYNSTDFIPKIIEGIRSIKIEKDAEGIEKTGSLKYEFENRGLNELMTFDEFNRIRALQTGEPEQLEQSYQKNLKDFQISDTNAKDAQDVMDQFNATLTVLKNEVMVKLIELKPELIQFSSALADFIKMFRSQEIDLTQGGELPADERNIFAKTLIEREIKILDQDGNEQIIKESEYRKKLDEENPDAPYRLGSGSVWQDIGTTQIGQDIQETLHKDYEYMKHLKQSVTEDYNAVKNLARDIQDKLDSMKERYDSMKDEIKTKRDARINKEVEAEIKKKRGSEINKEWKPQNEQLHELLEPFLKEKPKEKPQSNNTSGNQKVSITLINHTGHDIYTQANALRTA
jgi:hypothetical protein